MQSKERLERFRVHFESERVEILKQRELARLAGSLSLEREECFDETDLTAHELDQSMRLRLQTRQALYLKKIESALERIQDGSFGECESCGDEIESRRLEARPITECCISCKEEQERREYGFADTRQSRSLSSRMSLRSA